MKRERTFSESEMREIFNRANALQSRNGISLTELVHVGSEVGISAKSLDLAIQEIDAEVSASVPTMSGRLRLALRFLGFGVILGLGVSAITLRSENPPIGLLSSALLLGVLGTGTAAAVRAKLRRARAFFEFQIKNAALWGGFGVSVLFSFPADSTLLGNNTTILGILGGWLIQTFVMTAAVGGVVAAFLAVPKITSQTPDEDETIPLKRRIAEKLKRWIDIVLARVAVTTTDLASSV